MAGDESGHSPENGASVGRDQSPWILCDSTITPQFTVLRVKKMYCHPAKTQGSRHSPDRIPSGAQKSEALAETKSARPTPEQI
jgi:hypothetical protein